MKKKIGRILFWFKDENGHLMNLNDSFFAYANMYCRLINEKYDGVEIKFINIEFATIEKYEKYSGMPANYIHYCKKNGGNIAYSGVIDFSEFDRLNEKEQKIFIWNSVCEFLKKTALKIDNNKLFNAVDFAFTKGLELNLNPDYKMIENEVVIFDQKMKASVWIYFEREEMYSRFALEDEDNVLFEKEIDKTKNGTDYLLEIYKKIEFKGSRIIIKGVKGVEYLPLTIEVPHLLF